MREIKFRAWAKHGEMLPNVQNHIGNFDTAFGNMLKSDDFIIMQYTGLKDKNGVDIYEGDVVKESRLLSNGLREKNLVVEYKPPSYVAGDLDLSSYMGISREVIGNIHQNPELLAGGE